MMNSLTSICSTKINPAKVKNVSFQAWKKVEFGEENELGRLDVSNWKDGI